MQFHQDGGLSQVRYYLRSYGDTLEVLATHALSMPGRVVGRFVCQCDADDYWSLRVARDRTFAHLCCGCNGSSLPIYIGSPPAGPFTMQPSGPCACDEEFAAVAVGIGYFGPAPTIGTVDAERAQELVLATSCRSCGSERLAFELHLARPPVIRGDEPWIRKIQGLYFK